MKWSAKHILLSLSLLALLGTVTSCRKTVNCRCAVKGASGSAHALDVRVITVDSRSDCSDIYYVVYNGSELPDDQGLVDSLYCTDYAFDVMVVDSTITYSNGAEQ